MVEGGNIRRDDKGKTWSTKLQRDEGVTSGNRCSLTGIGHWKGMEQEDIEVKVERYSKARL